VEETPGRIAAGPQACRAASSSAFITRGREGNSRETQHVIGAVIFDLDGTLVDSNELHVLAWQETFRHFGKEIPIERLREQIGKGGDQYLPEFLTAMEIREFGHQADEYRGKIFKKKYLPEVRPFPKVRELFERVRQEDKKIALASSGKEDEVRRYEKLAGIEGLASSLVTADQVAHSKPKPDVFIAALRALGHLRPEEAIAIGDTPYDIEAAKKIGLPIIGLLCGGFSEEVLREKGAGAIFRDPADLLDRYYQSPLAG
jgi:HAD superfamily hydrolase (TIGR01509 family)